MPAFPGLVLRIALRGIASTQENGGVRSFPRQPEKIGTAWSPMPWPRSAAGIECLSGIPGTVGGTPVQNVGAYGQEVSQTIVTVRVFDRKTRQFVDLPAADLRIFLSPQHLQHAPNENATWSAASTTALHKNARRQLCSYADLARYFAAHNVPSPTLAEVRDAVRFIRAQKGMLLVAWRCGLPECRQLLQEPGRPGNGTGFAGSRTGRRKAEHPCLSSAERAR